MRPYGSSTIRMGTSTGIEPIFAGHYYSRSMQREITDEGRRTINQLSEMMRSFNDPIKPTRSIKSHKL